MKQRKKHSATPYDDVFRTLIAKGDNLLIPFVNELFQFAKPIPENALIENMANEQYGNSGSGKQQKWITDSHLRIAGFPFHIECQCYKDKYIIVRMVRYDIEQALENGDFTKEEYIIEVPYSGILFLRDTDDLAKNIQVRIKTHEVDGIYHIKKMVLSDYTLEELFAKKLLFLIPFYLFTKEKELERYNKDKEARAGIVKAYEEIIDRLNTLVEGRKINVIQYQLIIDMLKKVTDNLASKQAKARKELNGIMGGRVLEVTGEKYLRQELERGREQGLSQGKAEGINNAKKALKLIMKGSLSAEEIAQETKLSIDDVKDLENQLRS